MSSVEEFLATLNAELGLDSAVVGSAVANCHANHIKTTNDLREVDPGLFGALGIDERLHAPMITLLYTEQKSTTRSDSKEGTPTADGDNEAETKGGGESLGDVPADTAYPDRDSRTNSNVDQDEDRVTRNSITQGGEDRDEKIPSGNENGDDEDPAWDCEGEGADETWGDGVEGGDGSDDADEEWDDEGDDEGDWGDENDTSNDAHMPLGQKSETMLFIERKRVWDAKMASIKASSSGDAKVSKSVKFASKAVGLMLQKSLFSLMREYETRRDRRIEAWALDNNVFIWRVRFRGFGAHSKLGTDLTLLDSRYEGRDYIEAEIRFHAELFPFYPPEVVLVYPRLQSFFAAQIVCMPELLLEKWRPVTELPSLLVQIWTMLSKGARVDAALAVNDPKLVGVSTLCSRAESVLCRLSQVTSVPPRVFATRAAAKDAKQVGKRAQAYLAPTQLQRHLSGEQRPAHGDSVVSYTQKLAQMRQKRKDIKHAFCEVVASLLNTKLTRTVGDFTLIVSDSSLLSVMESYLVGADRVKMNKHSKIYTSVLTVCRILVRVPSLHHMLFVPVSKQGKSIHDYLLAFAGVPNTKVKTVVDALVRLLEAATRDLAKFYASLHIKLRRGSGPEASRGHSTQQTSKKGYQCCVCTKILDSWIAADRHITDCLLDLQRRVGAEQLDKLLDPCSRQYHVKCLGSGFKHAKMCPFCAKESGSSTSGSLADHVHRCWACPMCTRPVLEKDLKSHMDRCSQWYRDDSEELKSVDDRRRAQTAGLVKCQQNALKYVQDLARVASEGKRRALEARFVELGLKMSDLDLVLRYIRNDAPIIIHFDVGKVLNYFVNDTHYRNLFEVGTGGGSTNKDARSRWENTIFKNAYKNGKPFERPKYGVLNFANDPRGVLSCRQYGRSYMLLRNVRLRTTFARKDTSGVGSANEMATCEYYVHILEGFADEELKQAYEVANGDRRYIEVEQGGRRSTYREVQIHGEVRFDSDVSCFVIHPSYKSDPSIAELLRKLSLKHGVPWVWMES